MSADLKGLFFVITCICLMLFPIINSKSSQNNIESYETLTVFDKYYQLEMFYEDHMANIPDSFIQLFEKSNMSEVTLLMGMVNPESMKNYYQNNQNNKIKRFIPPISHGISLILRNHSLLSTLQFKSITQALSISRSEEFITYLSESELTFINNPNDKFCSQHLNLIIDMFFPCKTNAGIGSVINEKTFFVDKEFIGVKIHWNFNTSIISLKIIMDKSTQEVKNYLKLSLESRQSRRCMHFTGSKRIITNQEQDNFPIDTEIEIEKPIIYSESITTSFASNYYNPQKQMQLKIDLDNLLMEVEHHLSVNQNENQSWMINMYPLILTWRLMLPEGFEMQKVSYTCENCNESFVKNVSILNKETIDLKRSQEKHQELYTIQFELTNYYTMNSNSSIESHHQKPFLIFKFSYLSNLKSFEEYENIAGGGEEFINIPFTLYTSNGHNALIQSNSLRNMFDKLLEPDFSIPFKTITFTLAIIGYLWISLWKAFYAQISHRKSTIISKEINEKENSISKLEENNESRASSELKKEV